jgi:hypothetical protein
MYAINGLAYSLMSLGTLFAAFAFDTGSAPKWVRRTLIAHGLLTPIVTGALFVLLVCRRDPVAGHVPCDDEFTGAYISSAEQSFRTIET